MKKRNVLFIVGIIVLVALVIGVLYHFRGRRTYELNLTQLEKLKSISLKQDETERVIGIEEEMKEMLDILNGVKRITKEESIQDVPVNVDDEIKIDFNFAESGASTIFVYKKDNKYYIEQPYNGIYQISEDEYNLVKKVLE